MGENCAGMLKKNVSTLSHFPSAMQNAGVTKGKSVFIQTSGAVCVQASPVYSQVKYFKAALKHKKHENKTLVCFCYWNRKTKQGC